MTITTYEQSGLIITSDNGHKLAIDIGALTPLEKLNDVTVDSMLVSHIHADHCSAERVQTLAPDMIYTGAQCSSALAEINLPITEIEEGNSFTAADFIVTPFEVDHGPNAPVVPAQNFGFLIEVDEKKIYFAGDMYIPSGISVTDLSVDVALLPVGGHFTFDAQAALAFANQFKQISTIYPMHYEAVGPIDTTAANVFAQLAADSFTIAA